MTPNHSMPKVASNRALPASAPKPPLRWRSRLGVAVTLFLILGGLNFAAAVAVPFTLALFGPASLGGLVLGNEADGAFLGRSLSDVDRADPAMGSFLVTFMWTMCAYMMSVAVLQIGVAWFALRRAQMWALWSSLISNLAIVPYYLAIGWTFAQRGVPVIIGVLGAFGIPAALAIVATLVGRAGILQMKALPATTS